MRYHYVWLAWSGTFLLPWVWLYLANPGHRRVMLRTSLATAIFGLTEPIWVPSYWNPPSLFDLAQRTRFDIESLIFTKEATTTTEIDLGVDPLLQTAPR